jgi:hypothetical protein
MEIRPTTEPIVFAGIIHFPSISLQFLLRQLTADCLRNSLRPVAGREASFRFCKSEIAFRAQPRDQNGLSTCLGQNVRWSSWSQRIEEST